MQNTEVLEKLDKMMEEALIYALSNHPNENDIPLKDKTPSPKSPKKGRLMT